MFFVLIFSSNCFSFFFGGSLIDCFDEAFDVDILDDSEIYVSVFSSILCDDFDDIDDCYG